MKNKHCHSIDLDEIISDINKFQLAKKLANAAILDATRMNPVNLHGDRKISSSTGTNGEFEKRFDKLKPWLLKVE